MPRYISAGIPLDASARQAVASGDLVVTPDGRPPSTARVGAAPAVGAPAVGGTGIAAALASAQKAQKQANAANEDRYNQGLGAIQTAVDNSAKVGTEAKTRVEENRVNQAGSTAQSVISRGLNNFTISDALQRGVNKDAERSNQAIDEQVADRRSGLELQRANFIAARNDTGPDLSQWANLVSGAAASAPAAQRTGSVTHNSPLGGTPSISTPSFGGGSSGSGGGAQFYTGADLPQNKQTPAYGIGNALQPVASPISSALNPGSGSISITPGASTYPSPTDLNAAISNGFQPPSWTETSGLSPDAIKELTASRYRQWMEQYGGTN